METNDTNTYLNIIADAAAVDGVRPQVHAACPPPCVVIEMKRKDDTTRFFLVVPLAEEARVRAALNIIADSGVAVEQASEAEVQDMRQLHNFAAGKADAEMDF